MDHTSFQHWMTNIEKLDSVQYQQAKAAFSGEFEELEVASLAAIEATIDDDRKCRHCGAPGAISRGKARGLRRYQCKTCNRTFNAATGTVLQGIHKKEKLLAYASCISEGCTIKDSAARCGMSIPTAFYWRHRSLPPASPVPPADPRATASRSDGACPGNLRLLPAVLSFCDPVRSRERSAA